MDTSGTLWVGNDAGEDIIIELVVDPESTATLSASLERSLVENAEIWRELAASEEI